MRQADCKRCDLRGAKDADEVASRGGNTCVYNCVVDGVTRYVGITDDIVKRGEAHLRENGITIDRIEDLQNLLRWNGSEALRLEREISSEELKHFTRGIISAPLLVERIENNNRAGTHEVW